MYILSVFVVVVVVNTRNHIPPGNDLYYIHGLLLNHSNSLGLIKFGSVHRAQAVLVARFQQVDQVSNHVRVNGCQRYGYV
jgi:hypothetical protein